MSLLKLFKNRKSKGKDESKGKSGLKKHKGIKSKKKKKKDPSRTVSLQEEVEDIQEENNNEQILEEIEMPNTTKLSKKKSRFKEYNRNFQQDSHTTGIIDLNSDNE